MSLRVVGQFIEEIVDAPVVRRRMNLNEAIRELEHLQAQMDSFDEKARTRREELQTRITDLTKSRDTLDAVLKSTIR